MDAFHTPEAEELHDEIRVDLYSIKKRQERIAAKLKKAERVELVTMLLICCSLTFGGCLALEHTLSIQAKANQEVLAWAK